MNMTTSPYIGIKPVISSRSTAESSTTLIKDLVDSGYDYILTSITNNQYREKSKKLFQIARTSNETLFVPGPGLNDVNLFDGDHLKHTIGLISSWIELENPDQQISDFSKQVLINEIQYAKFIGLKHIIIAPPKDLINLSNYSRVIRDVLSLSESHHIIVSISLPICENVSSDNINSIDCFSTWDMWNSIRTSCDYHSNLKVSLAIPKNPIPGMVIERWFSEPVSCLLVSSSIFLINNKGYPVLSKQNQFLLTQFSAKNTIYLLHGLEKTNPELVDSSSYMHYINYLITKNHKEVSKLDNFAINHNDNLLPPLQPLKDDLDNFTYGAFEQDDVKYNLYKEAITCALKDMIHLNTINIAVVGAGRGGLVEMAYQAITQLNIKSKCHLTVIEKNQSACIYLQSKKQTEWNNFIEILNIDMRDWNPKESHNIIISELLGSFGCNELSPECLQPLEKYLDRSYGTFIPQSYSSYIAPVFTPKIHSILKNHSQSTPNSKVFEKPYVVRLLESCLCSNKINEVWNFEHPLSNAKLTRNTISTFKVKYKTVIHGFAGYFQAKLYNEIEISIHPDHHTTDLISWFPMFFPLETPLYVTDDTELEISISRESKNGKIWYCWGLETFMYLVVPGSEENDNSSNEFQVRVRTGITKIHNHGGEAFHIDELIA